MEATAADTPAALVSRRRASSSWLTNSSCFDLSGPTRACEGPVSTEASWCWAEAAMTESCRRDVTRWGPAPWGWSSTSWTWVRNEAPDLGDPDGGGAQRPDRPDLAPDHRHEGHRREQGRGQIGLGAGELGPGRVEQVDGTGRGQLTRGQIGLDLLQPARPFRSWR